MNKQKFFRESLLRKRIFFIICMIFISVISYSQDDHEKKDSAKDEDPLQFSLLLPPSSPAFTLLDISPESVERPGIPTDLIFTILNETNNFDTIPENFALEFAPYWFVKKSENADLNSTNFGQVFLQTLTFSVATKALQNDSESSSDQEKKETSIGFGFRFSLLRGSIQNTQIEELKKYFASYSNKLNSTIIQDKELKKLKIEFRKLLIKLGKEADPQNKVEVGIKVSEVRLKMDNRLKQIRESHDKKEKDLIAKITAVPIKRIGPKIDIAGGLAWNFPDKVFREGELQRWGLWANGGYQGKSWGLFGVLRHLGNKSTPDIWDIGGRLIWDLSEKFSISAESVYRINVDSDIKNEWGFDGIMEYNFAKNKSIALVIGKDNKDPLNPGRLVAKITFKTGFGSERTLPSSK